MFFTPTQFAKIGGLFCGLLLVAFMPTACQACDTPVYRYAMYRWEPSPYELYCIHAEDIAQESQKLHAMVEEMIDDKEAPLNLAFYTVDLRTDPQLQGIPADVKALYEALPAPRAVTYLAVTPLGQKLEMDPPNALALQAAATSPARQSLGRQLEAGACGVLLILETGDAAKDNAAWRIAEEIAADFEAGKIDVNQPIPGVPLVPGEAASQKSPRKIGLVKVARSDEQESWLVECLLNLEPDLKDFNEPMIFPVFGRARALPPFIGKGIIRENLLEAVYFMSGACSCTVKEQNPGMDLLMAYNWEGAAEKLAELYGQEEGNEGRFGVDFFPELILTPSSEQASGSQTAGQETTSGQEEAADPPAKLPAAEHPQAAGSADHAEAAEVPLHSVSQNKAENAFAHARKLAAGAQSDSAGRETTSSMMWTLGLGLAGTLLLLGAITVFTMRGPR